eukprot:5065552-Prymnesium_polylepis.1
MLLDRLEERLSRARAAERSCERFSPRMQEGSTERSSLCLHGEQHRHDDVLSLRLELRDRRAHRVVIRVRAEVKAGAPHHERDAIRPLEL